MDVVLTHDAEGDLEHLYHWITGTESETRADRILDELYEGCKSLACFPEKGRVVPELERLGLRTVLEIIQSPWRIIYEVLDETVYVYAVVDSRRDMKSFLEHRLLR